MPRTRSLNQRYPINIQRKIVPLSLDLDFLIWRSCHLFLSSYGVAIVAVSTLRLLCEHFGWKFSLCTSRKQGKSYEVNRLLVYGMRTIGKGYAGARKFCAIMKMPSPPTEKAFIFNSQVIGRHVKIIQKRV